MNELSQSPPALDIGQSSAVIEYVDRLRAELADVPPEERELLLSRAMAEIELEADVRYTDANDTEGVRVLLARVGSPTEVAMRLRPQSAQPSMAAGADSLTACRTCRREVSSTAHACPHCGAPFPARKQWTGTGYEWRSPGEFGGWPIIHIAWGRDANGRRKVARGVIAIGQFGIGAVTIAQFGIGFVFGFGQFVLAPLAIGQFAFGLLAAGQFGIGLLAGAGQIATGIFSAGMKAFGVWTKSSF